MSTDAAADTRLGRSADATGDAATARALLDDLEAAHAVGCELAGDLAAEAGSCEERLAEVMAVVAAVVRHSREAVAIVDGELDVRLASPPAVELLGGAEALSRVLPPGGAAEVRRCLVAVPRGDRPAGANEELVAGAPPAGPDHPPRPIVVRLRSGSLEVTVERVCAVRRPLGGLWGGWLPDASRHGRPAPANAAGGPRYPYGLVTLNRTPSGPE